MTIPYPSPPTVLFCSQCGTATEQRIPPDDSRLRAVCPVCQHIHYDNPKTVVGTIPVLGDKILLCKRGIEPGYAMWTLPAGFMECGEGLAQGAARETLEEALATVEVIEPVYSLVDIPHIGQTHVFFRANLQEGDFGAGHETLEVALFALDEIPWDDIAFNSVRITLQAFLADVARGEFVTRHHVRTLDSM
nr:NUDIX hydrolase [Hydromonas duriensis]